jgi:ribosomal protein S18 acetylase RimI-like enzyme
MEILPINDSNLDAAVAFVVRVNQDSAHNISYFGETEAEITADFTAIQPPEGYSFIAVSEDGQLCGLFGVEVDTELGRCWLLGPLVDHEDWEAVAGTLYDLIQAELPGEIVDQEMYFGKRNNRVQEFAIKQGFTNHGEGAVLTLDLSRRERIPTSNVSDFQEKFTTDFIALHAILFPNTYYSADQLIKLTENPDKHLFVCIKNEKLVGYVFIQTRQAFNDGYIDFLGVDEAIRRQGVGRQLVNEALNWVQTIPFVEKVTLTVNTDNVSGMQMYAGLGFQTESVSQSFRKRT